MKLKENLLLRQVAGSWVVVAVGTTSVDFNGLLTLNETGALLWRSLENESGHDGLVKALTDEYEVTADQASADVDEFLDKLQKANCLTE